MEQVIASCTGGVVSVTCAGPPVNDGASDNYACTMPAQEVQKLSLVPPANVFVTRATGVWIAYF